MPIYDLKCDTCGRELADEWLPAPLSDHDHDRPPCGAGCEGRLHNKYIRLTPEAQARLEKRAQERAPTSLRADGFAPFTYEGVHYGSREEWNKRRNEIAAVQKCDPERIVVVPTNRHERNRRWEESQQRVLDSNRRMGYTPEEARERREYNRNRNRR